jgi:bacterioferritin-associated ferredoxin
MASKEEIIDGMKIVCQCKTIKKRVFKELIDAGASTIEELQKATRAGSGQCKGKRCTSRLLDLIKQRAGVD